MALHITRADDGEYHCPELGCSTQSSQAATLRRHCKTIHNFDMTTVRPRTEALAAERAERKRERVRRLRADRAAAVPSPSAVKRRSPPPRPLYNYLDAEELGQHGKHDGLLHYGQSLISGGGNGIFATVNLKRGDYVTRYEGQRMAEEPANTEYTIAIEGKSGKEFLDGIRVPISGKGLGSFVNRESRAAGMKRKNCAMVQVGAEVYIELLQDVAAREELYTTYGPGYRIKKQ